MQHGTAGAAEPRGAAARRVQPLGGSRDDREDRDAPRSAAARRWRRPAAPMPDEPMADIEGVEILLCSPSQTLSMPAATCCRRCRAPPARAAPRTRPGRRPCRSRVPREDPADRAAAAGCRHGWSGCGRCCASCGALPADGSFHEPPSGASLALPGGPGASCRPEEDRRGKT